MSQYQAIKAATNAYIKTNGRQEITGAILNAVMIATIDSLGKFYQFVGVATPETDPGVIDQNIAYLASTPGTYTKLGGLSIQAGEVAALKFDGLWKKDLIFIIPSKVSQLENDLGYITNAVSDLINYYTKDETDTLLTNFFTKPEVQSILADYYDKDEVDSIVSAIVQQSYVVSWDGTSTPVVGDIPAGVVVTYGGDTYTGTLAPSASTSNKIYLVSNGVGFDEYITTDNSGYAWVGIGTTSLDLSGYATQESLEEIKAYMPELISGRFSKTHIDMSNIGHWYYAAKSDGTYGTTAGTVNSRIAVSEGDVLKITAPSGYLSRFGFLKSFRPPESGGAIDLVAGTDMTEIQAGTSIIVTAPVGAVALIFHCGASPYNYTPASIVVWSAKEENEGSRIITPIDSEGYRATTIIAANTGGSYTIPMKGGFFYQIEYTLAESGNIYNGYISGLPNASVVVDNYVGISSTTTGIRYLHPVSDCYYVISSNKAFTSVQVTEMTGEEDDSRRGFIQDDTDFVMNAVVPFAEVDQSSFTLRNYGINADTNRYLSSSSYKHILIPVTSGQYVRIKKGGASIVYAWLTSDDAPVAGGAVPFVTGTIRYTSSVDILVKVPAGAAFLFIYYGSSPYTSKPSSIGIATQDEEDPDVVPGMAESGNGSAISKLFLNESRPYYFAQGWGADEDYGHLDKMLALVPEGRHFISFTDIHLDYGNNWGLQQKQMEVMSYVQERLRMCRVVFGGDFIGQQPTEDVAKKEMTWFVNECYSMFGARFVPVLGDHDTDRVNGGLEQGSQLSEQYIFDTYFKDAFRFGAVEDSLGISAIDDVTFSETPETDAVKKAAWKNYMRMHYYVDDEVNKIRFITITQGAVFRDIPNRYNIPGMSLFFICNALQSIPLDYDVVVVAHEFQMTHLENASTIGIWDRELFNALTAFKNHTTFTLSSPYYAQQIDKDVWDAIAAKYGNTNFDFTEKEGRVVTLQGDNHYDDVGYYDAGTNFTHFAVEYTPTSSDVLWVTQDRCALTQNRGFQASWGSNIPSMLKNFRRAKASTIEENLIGTTNEVLFDVFTINEDGLTITRFGDTPTAGKAGLYPVFDEAEFYSVGDIVIYYVMDGDLYVVKAFQFTSAHIPGAFDISEVDEVIVTEPYVRNFVL